MIPLLTYPLALLAAATLPALAAIYILRNRFRRRPVSSLMLWQFAARSREGGAKVHRIQLPIIFFLELLALALLVTAATGPRWQLAATTRPLLVVLDDSVSMLAGSAEDNPRSLSIRALEQLLQSRKFLSIRCVAAGPKPRMLGGAMVSPGEVRETLPQWTCQSPAAALEAAVALALDVGGPLAEVLVLTDRAPENSGLANQRVQWWAFGSARPNLAFVNATRSVHGDKDRVLLEVANFSTASATATLRITSGSNLLRNATVTLEPNARHRLVLNLPAQTPGIEAALGPDALEADNRVALLPAPRKRVRVLVSIEDEPLRTLITRTLESTGLRAALEASPELVIHQTRGLPAGTNAWSLRLISLTNATSFTGPFIVDSTHPLTRGLELEGAVWAASALTNPPNPASLPLITAGNVSLLLAQPDALGRQQLTLNLTPDRSTLTATPNWPVLFWNLLAWRARETPGPVEHNFRLGSDVVVKTAGPHLKLTRPDASVREFERVGEELILETETPGRHLLTDGVHQWEFAVNLLSAGESDLSGAAPGKWGEWEQPDAVRREYTSVLWMFALAALVALVAHLFLVTHSRGKL